jgi:hypothetical protein
MISRNGKFHCAVPLEKRAGQGASRRLWFRASGEMKNAGTEKAKKAQRGTTPYTQTRNLIKGADRVIETSLKSQQRRKLVDACADYLL